MGGRRGSRRRNLARGAIAGRPSLSCRVPGPSATRWALFLSPSFMPHFGWRAVFFVGVAPALVTLWLQRGGGKNQRPGIEQRAEHPKQGTPSANNLFRGALGRSVLICASMNAAALFACWGLFTWIPRFLSMSVAEGGRGLSIAQTSAWTIVMQGGTFLGYIVFGYLADRYNRKNTYISFLVVAALLVPVFAFLRNLDALLIIGPLVGFFGTGYFSGFIVITSELFPISLRASAMGFVYNIGRIFSAAAPYLIGHIQSTAV